MRKIFLLLLLLRSFTVLFAQDKRIARPLTNGNSELLQEVHIAAGGSAKGTIANSDRNALQGMAVGVTPTQGSFPFLSGEVVKKPNIVVILVDDMGYSDLSCMGSEIPTPNIDGLAKNGVLFTHFYNASRCCPSRASLLTGLYQTRAGMGHMNTTKMDAPEYRGTLSHNAVTIAEVLKDNGYRTIMTGKWHVGDEPGNWPMRRGFERFYGVPVGGGIYFYPTKFLDRPIYFNENKVKPDPGWYSTDSFNEYAIRFMKEAVTDDKPFFLYQAHIAPHFPLQAKETDIAGFKGKYDAGYETIRQQRYQRQKELGVISKDTRLSPENFSIWSDVEDKKREARKMEVYAAQMACLDQNVGLLIQNLKDLGVYENTVIIFLSDNGACAEEVNRSKNVEIGGADSFVSYGKNWANVSNTPYRLFKSFTHEGGILTPMIFSWPAGIPNPGVITAEPAHINDIMPVCLELAGAKYPKSYAGNKIFSLDGVSFLPIISGGKQKASRPFYFQHMGNEAIRKDDWKLVRRFEKDWELFYLKDDPTEMSDLSNLNSMKLKRMLNDYNKWEKEYGVLPWPIKE